MLLTITMTRRPATDPGYLLHKHFGRFQSYDLSFGKAHVFDPEAADDRCTACLLLESTAEAKLSRLRSRGRGRKRSLALGEFALGVEGLERFVRREPLRRVHACVFGVLALVDPRL
jgi:hypothetical protein